ncbi:MAG: UDP-N-acetylmuramate--L-alanine ligase [Gammaproteobacteria bacterium]
MPDIHSHGMGRVKHVHFIGIGGAGMGGIAEVLKNLGYTVSGSDVKENRVTRRLKSLDIDVHIGHSPEYVEKSDVVVITSAIKPDNIELDAARSLRIPVVRRAEMLAELMRFNQGIAIAGTHGKTTTTSLVASVLAEAGLDPTYVIGGLLNSSGTNARLGSGKYFVAEADESDASFLHLHPVISVITNIDADHLDTYGGDMANLRNHFIEFLRQLPFYGLAILCVDDEGIRKILPEVTRPVVTYGLDFEADYNAELIRQEGNKTWFRVSHLHNRDWLEIELNLPGRHNLRNALAAIAVAHELGVEDQSIVNALRNFQGIARRCHVRGQVTIGENTATLIDDYAHHPTEIAACFDAIHGGWEGRRLVVVYQPHRYTRMRDLFEDFCQVLSRADVLLVLDVYPAGEEPITSADSRSLCRAIRLRGQIEPISIQDPATLQKVLAGVLKEDDLLLTLGAGDIGAMSRKLYEDCATTVH